MRLYAGDVLSRVNALQVDQVLEASPLGKLSEPDWAWGKTNGDVVAEGVKWDNAKKDICGSKTAIE